MKKIRKLISVMLLVITASLLTAQLIEIQVFDNGAVVVDDNEQGGGRNNRWFFENFKTTGIWGTPGVVHINCNSSSGQCGKTVRMVLSAL